MRRHAYHSHILSKKTRKRKRRLRASVSPVVVELPTGIGAEPDHVRRTRLATRLQRAIGYHITFGDDES